MTQVSRYLAILEVRADSLQPAALLQLTSSRCRLHLLCYHRHRFHCVTRLCPLDTSVRLPRPPISSVCPLAQPTPTAFCLDYVMQVLQIAADSAPPWPVRLVHRLARIANVGTYACTIFAAAQIPSVLTSLVYSFEMSACQLTPSTRSHTLSSLSHRFSHTYLASPRTALPMLQVRRLWRFHCVDSLLYNIVVFSGTTDIVTSPSSPSPLVHHPAQPFFQHPRPRLVFLPLQASHLHLRTSNTHSHARSTIARPPPSCG
jgi:hypothetical protein